MNINETILFGCPIYKIKVDPNEKSILWHEIHALFVHSKWRKYFGV